MVLDKLKLIEASTLETNFRMTDKPQGEGSLEVTFGKLNFESGGNISGEEGRSAIVISAEPKVVGVDKFDGKEAFSLRIKIKMIYSYPSEEKVDEATIRECSWYFSSFTKTYFKIFADQIFQQAGITGIALPLN
ncbi:hypothetical protein ABW09_11980 [Pluralibacter gergoviae]|uniref:hypothetical protein n=1 Tax=Pluralibacter gergoviae TaxID=61647 RepID=UPI0006513B6B|nr:hypothetical protein [Pluralibacter gergoviae]KMK17759.1 hypothetical protein ABW09_11980 [Pluralibacter gergoviae]